MKAKQISMVAESKQQLGIKLVVTYLLDTQSWASAWKLLLEIKRYSKY